MMNYLKRFLIILLVPLIGGISLSVVNADEKKKPPTAELSAESVESRIANLNRLVNTSSGARRIKASHNSIAMAKRDEAQELLEKAGKNFRDGDLTAADRVLGRVTSAMFEAIRLVGTGGATEKKHGEDFDALYESVNVLLTALKRIAKEKNVMAEVEPKVREYQSEAEKARSLRNAGKVDEGRKLLDKAYVSTKVAIEGLRSGDTLVRSLNFATKEDEYNYEVSRNETHKMLVKVLLEEKMQTTPSLGKMVSKFLEKAKALRGQAEAQANSGDYDKAVATMEASTKEMVRAIRSAGVYIPG